MMFVAVVLGSSFAPCIKYPTANQFIGITHNVRVFVIQVPLSHLCGSSRSTLRSRSAPAILYKYTFVGGRLRLSYERSWKLYVLTAVNTVSSRSLQYICGFQRFSAIADLQITAT